AGSYAVTPACGRWSPEPEALRARGAALGIVHEPSCPRRETSAAAGQHRRRPGVLLLALGAVARGLPDPAQGLCGGSARALPVAAPFERRFPLGGMGFRGRRA